MTIDGWPEDISVVPKNLRKYFSHASTLTVEDGLILWAQVIHQLHERHQGITEMNLQAKNVIYWPGMTKYIEQMINSCNTCQYFQARQCDLPLEKQPTCNCPWQIMASDLFSFDGEPIHGHGWHVLKDVLCVETPFYWNNISSHYQYDEGNICWTWGTRHTEEWQWTQ